MTEKHRFVVSFEIEATVPEHALRRKVECVEGVLASTVVIAKTFVPGWYFDTSSHPEDWDRALSRPFHYFTKPPSQDSAWKRVEGVPESRYTRNGVDGTWRYEPEDKAK